MNTNTTINGNKVNYPTEALISLKTLAAAANRVQGQSRDRQHRITIVSCNNPAQVETEKFISKAVYA